MFGHRRNSGADGIAGLAQFVHKRFQLGHNFYVSCEERIPAYRIPRLERNFVRSELAQVTTNDDAIRFPEPLFRDRGGGDTDGRFSRGRAPTTSMIANSILLPIGIIGMTGTKRIDQIAIVLTARIFIADQQRNRRPRGLALEHPGENFDGIGLLPLCHMARGAGLTAVEVFLNIFSGQRKAWGTAIDDTADRGPMAFAKGREGEDVTERITGHT